MCLFFHIICFHDTPNLNNLGIILMFQSYQSKIYFHFIGWKNYFISLILEVVQYLFRDYVIDIQEIFFIYQFWHNIRGNAIFLLRCWKKGIWYISMNLKIITQMMIMVVWIIHVTCNLLITIFVYPIQSSVCFYAFLNKSSVRLN